MAITEDASSPAAVSTTSATAVTTASFSPPAASLLLALVSSDGSTSTATTASVTDSLSHSWTLLKRQNTHTASAGGTCEVWAFYLTAAPGSMTVTATQTAGTANGMLLSVKALVGAAKTQPGAVAGKESDSSAPTQALTTTVSGSFVYGCLGDFSGSTTFTANSATSIVSQLGDTTNNNTYVTCKSNGATGTPGSTTFGFTAPSTCAYNFALVEILPAPPSRVIAVQQAVKRAAFF